MEQSNSNFGTEKISKLLLKLAPPIMFVPLAYIFSRFGLKYVWLPLTRELLILLTEREDNKRRLEISNRLTY